MELVPPSTDAKLETFLSFLESINRSTSPSYVSIGWRGSFSSNPLSRSAVIHAASLAKKLNIPLMQCVCCMNMSPKEMTDTLDELAALGIRQLLILRGVQKPEGLQHFATAADLIRFVMSQVRWRSAFAGIAVTVKCDSNNPEQELQFLSQKEAAGANLIITPPVTDLQGLLHVQNAYGGKHQIVPGILMSPPIEILRWYVRRGMLHESCLHDLQANFPAIWDHIVTTKIEKSARKAGGPVGSELEASYNELRIWWNENIALRVVDEVVKQMPRTRQLHFFAYDYSQINLELLRSLER